MTKFPFFFWSPLVSTEHESFESSVSIDLTADYRMTNNIVRDFTKTFLKRALCYYFLPQKYYILAVSTPNFS